MMITFAKETSGIDCDQCSLVDEFVARIPRYQRRSIIKATKSDERTNMRPQPLQPRSASRIMADAKENQKPLADFLKVSEPIAILHEQHISELATQKAAVEYIEQTKQSSETVLLAPLRRKISSTFAKDTPEQPKPSEQNSPSPSFVQRAVESYCTPHTLIFHPQKK